MGEIREMPPPTPVGRREGPDKRTALRFDAKGRLAGHLIGSNQPVFIQNLGLGGFAAEVSEPLPAGCHIVRLTTLDRTSTVLEARSVYCRPTPEANGRFSAGFEFVRPPQDVDRAIKGVLQGVTNLRLQF